jgi:hypothetical protein
LGEYLQERAEGRSRRSIAALLDMRADHANLRTGETIRRVSPEEVTAGQIIVVKPGERCRWTGKCWRGLPSWTPRPSPESPLLAGWGGRRRFGWYAQYRWSVGS